MHDVTINDTNLLGRIGTQRIKQFSPTLEEGQLRPLDGRVLPITVLEKPTFPDVPERKQLPSEELLRLARVHAATTALLFEGEV